MNSPSTQETANPSLGRKKKPLRSGKIDMAELSALEAAVNSAASGVSGLWLSFLTFMAYLTMAVGSVSHEMLLLAKPIKLPVLNVELPLVAFFWIAPIFFVLFHFYLLLQISILVRKVASYNQCLVSAMPSEIDQERRRKRLDSFIVIQFLFGAEEERAGTTSKLLRGVSFITLVLAPILLLLQFQVSFLPYHASWVTWAHRITILVDLRLTWIFWTAICFEGGKVYFPELYFGRALINAGKTKAFKRATRKLFAVSAHSLSNRRRAFLCSGAVVFISLFGLAYKGELLEKSSFCPALHRR